MRGTRFSVRQLATFLFREGDLYKKTTGPSVDAEEGVRVQREVQKRREQDFIGYQRERAVGTRVHVPTGRVDEFELSGRMDGFYVDEEDTPVLEEFKACGLAPADPDPVDYGQLFLYGCLSALSMEDEHLTLRLIYVEAATLEETLFTWRVARRDLLADFRWLMTLLSVAVERHQLHLEHRAVWQADLAFPLPDFRPGQQAVARRIFRAVRARSDVLLEAPTGSGKSLGILFPTIRALQGEEQVFYSTGRNAGREAALNALALIDPRSEHLIAVELTAKEKICFVAGMPCDPDVCQYARGYFDRVGKAVTAGVEQRLCDRGQIEALAEIHTVCPYELSLDLAQSADLIIGDYNYVFDPVVRLQRFAGNGDLHVLVDEAHQLVPRAQAMLSVTVSRREVLASRDEAPATITPRLRSLDRAIKKYKKGLLEGDHRLPDLRSMDRAAQKLITTVQTLELDLTSTPALRSLYLTCLRWCRAEEWLHQGTFFNQLSLHGREVQLAKTCLDPAPYLQAVSAEHATHIRFSATLSPLELSKRVQGFEAADAERAQNPFQTDQLGVYLVADLSTYFHSRTRTVPDLCRLIRDVYESRPGRYLIALPSYAYLNQVAGEFAGDAAGEVTEIPLFLQERGADADMLARLVDAFTLSGGLLLVVMGGGLSESIDFKDARLDGVVVVGLGLPPPSLARDQLATYFNAQAGDGFGQLVAYTQPALVKILQAAGRLIRAPEDRGILCLVDPRFPSVQSFFPAHWQVRIVPAREVKEHVREFWSR